jgi:hypothetical protein
MKSGKVKCQACMNKPNPDKGTIFSTPLKGYKCLHGIIFYQKNAENNF